LSAKWLMPLFFVGLFLFWEASIPLFSIPAYILPLPSLIIARGWAGIPLLVKYTLITGAESVIGFIVAAVLAVPLGLVRLYRRHARAHAMSGHPAKATAESSVGQSSRTAKPNIQRGRHSRIPKNL
jgi:ABC-type nitrate/sulfonate/bicarbonate transport system permease component